MSAAPPPLGTVVPGVPDALAALVSRCLEPDPANRHASSADLLAELERLDDNGVPIPEKRHLTPRLMAVAAVLVLALLTATFLVTRRAVQPAQAHEPMSVLIADIGNATGDAEFNHTLEPMIRLAQGDSGPRADSVDRPRHGSVNAR